MEEVALFQAVPAVQESLQGSTEVLNLLHRGDFRPRTHAGVSGSGTPEPQRLPAPGEMPGGRGPDLPRCGFVPQSRDATPCSVCRSSPETSPPEPGWESCTIHSLRSQYISSLRSRVRSQQPPLGPPAIAIPISMTFTASAKICLSALNRLAACAGVVPPGTMPGGLPAPFNAVCSLAILCYVAVSHRPVLQ
jgi:hypothetical protein